MDSRLPDKAFIFSGQSNATNIGFGEIPLVPNAEVLMLENEQWIPARNPFPGEMMNRVAQGISIWPSLGSRYNLLTQRRVYLTGYANSGQNISHWDPGTAGWTELVSQTRKGCLPHSTFVWYQGESDSTNDRKIQYEARLRDLFARIRELCSFESLVIVSLGDVEPQYAANLGWDFGYIRTVQSAAISGAIVVPASGLALQDNVHLSSDSLVTLGNRIAESVDAAD